MRSDISTLVITAVLSISIGADRSYAAERASEPYLTDPPETVLSEDDYFFWGTSGDGDGEFSFPAHVLIDRDSRAVVVDRLNHRIQVFELDGSHIDTWTAGFFRPEKIAQASTGEYYVADTDNQRIVRLTNEGGFISSWSIGRPRGLAIGPDDAVYVAEWSGRLHKFSLEGQRDLSWGTDGEVIIGGLLEAVSLDSAGRLFVLSSDQVIVLSPEGVELARWGSFDSAQDLFIDKEDRVIVADTDRNVVQIFTAAGGLERGLGEGLLSEPHGIGQDLAGRIYIADTGNDRITVFRDEIVFKQGKAPFDDADPPWERDLYDSANLYDTFDCITSHDRYMWQCGCFTTSVATLLRLHSVVGSPMSDPTDRVNTDPRAVNDFMKQHLNTNGRCFNGISGPVSVGYACGIFLPSGMLEYTQAAKLASGQEQQPLYAWIERVTLNDIMDSNGNNDTMDELRGKIERDLGSGDLIVAKVNDESQHWSAVLRSDDSTFILGDPSPVKPEGTTTLTESYSNNVFAYHRFGSVDNNSEQNAQLSTSSMPLQVDTSYLQLSSASPEKLLVTDAHGRRSGFLPDGSKITQIPESSAFFESQYGNPVTIPPTSLSGDGMYIVYVKSPETGNYTVSVSSETVLASCGANLHAAADRAPGIVRVLRDDSECMNAEFRIHFDPENAMEPVQQVSDQDTRAVGGTGMGNVSPATSPSLLDSVGYPSLRLSHLVVLVVITIVAVSAAVIRVMRPNSRKENRKRSPG